MVNAPLETLTVGFLSFCATNVDDLFVLALFFGQAKIEGSRRWPIVAGQYLGFGLLIALSLTGCLLQTVAPRSWLGLLGVLPILLGLREYRRNRNRETARTDVAVGKAASWTGTVWPVAIVTVANGADNLGVYVPLFAASDLSQLYLTLALFGLLIAAWCTFSHWIGTQPAVSWTLRRRSARLVPWLYAGLGIYILIEAQSWTLIR